MTANINFLINIFMTPVVTLKGLFTGPIKKTNGYYYQCSACGAMVSNAN
jgi:rRNA maturation endonuclease Nob1